MATQRQWRHPSICKCCIILLFHDVHSWWSLPGCSSSSVIPFCPRLRRDRHVMIVYWTLGVSMPGGCTNTTLLHAQVNWAKHESWFRLLNELALWFIKLNYYYYWLNVKVCINVNVLQRFPHQKTHWKHTFHCVHVWLHPFLRTYVYNTFNFLNLSTVCSCSIITFLFFVE